MRETLPVVEIFDSIQGEGVFVGTPCTFIRLWGCPPPHCEFCDTRYAWDPDEKRTLTHMTVDQIVEGARGAQHVVITGGEPLIWPLTELVLALQPRQVEIETSGKVVCTLSSYLHAKMHITVSPKRVMNYEFHPSLRRVLGALKYVVDEGFDLALTPIPLLSGVPIFLQPCWYSDPKQREEMLQRTLSLVRYGGGRFRLSVQLHKLLGLR